VPSRGRDQAPQLGRAEATFVAHQVHLARHIRLERQWIVRADGDRHAGLEQPTNRVRGQRSAGAGTDVARWAQVERNLVLGQVPHQRRVLDGPHPMPNAHRPQVAQGVPD